MECTKCGATAMIAGTMMESASGGNISFLFKNISYLKSIFGIGNRKVEAFACLHCSHVELMIDFTDEDRARYQEFEGPQPPVIDRIG